MNFSEMLPQLISALVMVLALMAALAWIARRMRLPHLRQGRGTHVSVCSSMNIGQREKLVVVQFGDQNILLGVTANQIQPLATSNQSPEQATEISAARPLTTNLETDLKTGLKNGLKTDLVTAP